MNNNIIDSSLLDEIIITLSKSFDATIQIKSIIQLSEPDRRNRVLRIELENSKKNIPASIIFKQSLEENSSADNQEALNRFARDWAGLEFLSNLKNEPLLSPHFYGGNTNYRFILLEDLGHQHISLVDSLTTSDPDAATNALVRFMKTLGQFHGNGFGRTHEYFEILHKLNPNIQTWQDNLKNNFDNITLYLKQVLLEFEIPYTAQLENEIDLVVRGALEPGEFTTLIHGDICPDNTFDDLKKNELRFIDFEWGGARNALLDGTYLQMGMPTCWCSKSIPKELIESLELIYRNELIKKIPAANHDTAYHKAYVQACAFWMLHALSFLEKSLSHDFKFNSGPTPELSLWNPEENLSRPRILSRLEAFIDVAIKYNQLPILRSMAEKILKEVTLRWPESKSMDMFPCYKILQQ